MIIQRAQFLFDKFFSTRAILNIKRNDTMKSKNLLQMNKTPRVYNEKSKFQSVHNVDEGSFKNNSKREFDGYTLSLRLKGISVRLGSPSVYTTFLQWLKEDKYKSVINNLAIFNTAIDLISKGGHLRYSLDICEEMIKREIQPDGRTVCTLLSCLAHQMRKPNPPENHKETFTMIMEKFWGKRKPQENIFVMNGVLRYYGGCDINRLLKALPPNLNIYEMVSWKPDVVSYSIVLESLARSNRPDLALVYHKVKPEDVVPDILYYKALMHCLYMILYQQKLIDPNQLLEIVKSVQAKKFEYSNSSKSLHANILNCLRKLSEFKFAVEHFNAQILPFLDKGNVDQQIIAFHIRSLLMEDQSQAAFELFDKLKRQFSFKPELFVLTTLMECCAKQKSASKAEALLNGYVKTGSVAPSDLLMKYYKRAVETSGLPKDEIQSRVKKVKDWYKEDRETGRADTLGNFLDIKN
jgi:hypothetical protein